MTGVVALSIAKLRVGAEAYQLSGIAESLDDYYTGNGEAPGHWVGRGIGLLGLSGEVEPDDLRAVLAGIAPNTGGLTPNGDNPVGNARRVPGFDLTFKVPKSVSVLYAVSDDPRVQGAIIEAGNAAVETAIGWLEREAIRVRRGSNNRPWVQAQERAGRTGLGIREEPTEGLVAASFRHRTSRAGDPFLHWHVLAANMTQGVDGKWSAFVHPELYRHARAAGEVFQAAVRNELTMTLGLEWRPGRHVHEVAGVPDSIMQVFSKRRAEIEDFARATGTPTDPAGNQAAALATRRSKSEQESSVGLSERWAAEASSHGWGPEKADDLLGTGRPRATVDYEAGVWKLPDIWFDETGRPHHADRTATPEEWIAAVLRQDLTNDRATFSVPDAVQAVAHRLGEGSTIDTIERVTNRLMASTQVLPLDGDGPARFTSRELHQAERRFAAALITRAPQNQVPTELIDAAIAARPTIGADQAKAVRALTTTNAAVSVLVGPAGTGKTYALEAVREIFQHSGHHVLGAAPSARAATELASGAGIAASTMHSMLAKIDRGEVDFSSSTVLVIDEAGMADIRTLEKLTEHAVSSGARLILVGDQHQLPEVGAGGGFAYAAKHSATVTELDQNRRQKQPWEQHALRQLRNGSVPDAIKTYQDQGRVLVAPDSAAMIETAVSAWFDARSSGLDLVLQAGTNATVDQLNAAVLDRLSAPNGPLHVAPGGDFAGTHFRTGEQIIVRKNYHAHDNPDIRIRNGQSGVVNAVRDGRITVHLDDQPGPISLDQHFIAAGGRLTHGYAHTTHRTQGGTWDASIAVGLDGLYREGAYTALSRGRYANTIIITDPEARQIEAERDAEPQRHDAGLRLPSEEPASSTEELTKRVSKSQAKRFAIDDDRDLVVVDRLVQSLPYTDLRDRAARASQIERLATHQVGDNLEDLSERVDRYERTARHIAPGVIVKATDRDNIGTVTSVNDQAATAAVRFVAPDGREATRTMGWVDLSIMDRGATVRPLTAPASAWLDGHIAHLAKAQAEWNSIVVDGGSHPDAARLYRRAETTVANQAAAHLTAECPVWLTTLLGQRPASPEGATTWDSAVATIVKHRLGTETPDSVPGLGDRLADPSGWDHAARQIAAARNWLHAHPEHAEPNLPDTPSREELLQRKQHVDAILATAPADQTETIDQLLGGQLSFADTGHLLDEAMADQTDRSRWIIENWPHIIEAAEIDSALEGAQGSPVAQTGTLPEPGIDLGI